jgi:hypothetical protein
MGNLASSRDVEERLDRDLSPAEMLRIEKLLADVSATVRGYTGQQFEQVARTTRVRVRNGVVVLTQRPVVSVATVAAVDGSDVDFTWDGLDRVTLWPAAGIDWFERNYPANGISVVDVTYTAGTATVPDEVRAVVVQMAARAFGRASDDSGLQSETIAGYSYAVGAAGAAGAAGMMNDERSVLDRYRRVGGVAWTGGR